MCYLGQTSGGQSCKSVREGETSVTESVVGSGAWQLCHTHKNKCTIQQQQQVQRQWKTEAQFLSERKKSESTWRPAMGKETCPPVPGPVLACLLPDKRNNMHVFYGNTHSLPPLAYVRNFRVNFLRMCKFKCELFSVLFAHRRFA